MLTKNLVIFKCLFLFIFCSTLLSGDENRSEVSSCGILIVTFHTGPKGERLERVRFFIKDEEGVQQMYPKGVAYVNDPNSCTCTVVVEDLKPGRYWLEFIVPNADGMFVEIPKREFIIRQDQVTKIDQVIKMQIKENKG